MVSLREDEIGDKMSSCIGVRLSKLIELVKCSETFQVRAAIFDWTDMAQIRVKQDQVLHNLIDGHLKDRGHLGSHKA